MSGRAFRLHENRAPTTGEGVRSEEKPPWRNVCLFVAAFIHTLFQAVYTLLITCEIKNWRGLDVAGKGAYTEFSALGHRSLKRLSTLAA